MSPVQSRKRRRSVALESAENIGEVREERSTSDAQQQDQMGVGTQKEDTDIKAAQVWEAFREEYYEVLEQLPLTLHRSFALMYELDEQAKVHNDELLRSILEYIKFRKSLCDRPQSDLARFISREDHQVETTADREIQGTSSTRASQALLSHIAWLSEEVVRASQEKVNVAQSAYDSADRQIRLLDFAINEQETSIKFGPKPGTHLPILSDAVVGRWVRPPRETEGLEQGMLSVSGVVQDTPNGDGVPNLGIVALDNTDRELVKTAIRRAKKHKGKKRLSNPNTTRANGITVTVPPLSSVALQTGDMPVDPHEPRYCYCNQVSFGEMIACDGSNCELEWFHLGCAGLADAPKGEWYCRNCQAFMKSSYSRRAR